MPPQSRANKRETISGYKGDLWREDSSIYKVTWQPLSSVGGQNASGLNGHKLGRMSELEFRDKYKWDGWHFQSFFLKNDILLSQQPIFSLKSSRIFFPLYLCCSIRFSKTFVFFALCQQTGKGLILHVLYLLFQTLL